jgi:hypothetical protein
VSWVIGILLIPCGYGQVSLIGLNPWLPGPCEAIANRPATSDISMVSLE